MKNRDLLNCIELLERLRECLQLGQELGFLASERHEQAERQRAGLHLGGDMNVAERGRLDQLDRRIVAISIDKL